MGRHWFGGGESKVNAIADEIRVLLLKSKRPAGSPGLREMKLQRIGDIS